MSQQHKSRQLVDHYGVFKDSDSGYQWLLQQGVAVSAIGLPEKHCPFRIKTTLLMCPHKFDLKDALERDAVLNEYESRLNESEVLQQFDPIYALENPGSVYIQVSNIKQYNSLIKLQRLMNPSVTSATPASLAKEQASLISKRLKASNLTSYIVYGLSSKDLKLVDDLARAALVTPGKLILAGEAMPLYNTADLIRVVKADPALFSFIDKVTDKKIKDIGAYRVKKYMRS